jgi:dihydroorotate dehydrogenase
MLKLWGETVDIYKSGIRPLLFGLKVDPEFAHQQSLQILGWLDRHADRPPARLVRQQLHQAYSFTHPSLEQTLWGSRFANPIGIAAGFDKDGLAARIWQDFGFGFAELGTVTCHAQPGNPKPRLFRLPQDGAVLNRMGFNNQGAAALAERLTSAPKGKIAIPIGVNLGKSKVTPLDGSAEDYAASFRQLKALGDYFVVNVSSPNTPGLRSLQSTEQLEPILSALQKENTESKPLLVKIAPDLEWEAIAAVIDLAQQYQLAGIIATNTTIRRDRLRTQILQATGQKVTDEAGGISGAPLRERSTEVIRFIYQQTQGTLPIVGVGGIFTAEDAWEKMTAGASLVQVYTGWIYEGPGMVQRILRGVVEKMAATGIKEMGEAIGRGASK